MAQAHFIKKAQKNIYVNGKYVSYVSKKGKKEGQTLSRLDRTVPKDESDQVLIAKGESYYYWAFKNGPIHYSKTRPKQSQLTQSNYLSQIYEFSERISEFNTDDPDELRDFIDNLKSDVENLRDETQGSLDNMPEGLKQGSTGELLQERIDSLESAESELDCIDCDSIEVDEDEIKDEVLSEHWNEEKEFSEEKWEEDEWAERLEKARREKIEELISEKLEELQSVSFE